MRCSTRVCSCLTHKHQFCLKIADDKHPSLFCCIAWLNAKSARGSKKIGATTLSITRLNTIIFSIIKKKMWHSAWLSIMVLSLVMLSVVAPIFLLPLALFAFNQAMQQNKLGCLSSAILRQNWCLWVRQERTRVEHPIARSRKFEMFSIAVTENAFVWTMLKEEWGQINRYFKVLQLTFLNLQSGSLYYKAFYGRNCCYVVIG